MRKKQYDVFKWMTLLPIEWGQILGVEVLDPDGWRQDGADFEAPTVLADYVRRVIVSTVKMSPDNDLSDVIKYQNEEGK